MKKSEKIQIVIRCILSIALCVAVFDEAGIFTAISLFLIMVAIEAMSLNLKILNRG